MMASFENLGLAEIIPSGKLILTRGMVDSRRTERQQMPLIFKRGKTQQTVLEAGARWRVPEYVRASIHDDTLVLLHIGRGIVYKANSTGALVWKIITGLDSREHVTESLVKQYNAPEQQIRQHIGEFIATLSGQGLIVAERCGQR
jgi:hypothetical protein